MVVYVENNKLINKEINREIIEPAILLDINKKIATDSALIAFGEEFNVLTKYAMYMERTEKYELNRLADALTIITFDTKDCILSLEEIAYIINRMDANPSTDFINDFVNHLNEFMQYKEEEDNYKAWIASEMKEYPWFI